LKLGIAVSREESLMGAIAHLAGSRDARQQLPVATTAERGAKGALCFFLDNRLLMADGTLDTSVASVSGGISW
jgi:hypothetical protein